MGAIVGINTLLLLANMGTPLMWAGFCHLVFGNAILGIAEGLLAAWLFRIPTGRAIGFMILANYVSMLAGVAAVNWIGVVCQQLPLFQPILYWIPTFLVFSVICFWALTVLIEWPFVRLSSRKEERRWWRAFRQSLVIQSTSYVGLFALYLWASPISLYTHGKLRKTREFIKPTPAHVYFVKSPEMTLHRISLMDFKVENLSTDILDDTWRRIYPLKVAENRWDLYWAPNEYRGSDRDSTGTLLLESFAGNCAEFRSRNPSLPLHKQASGHSLQTSARSFEGMADDRPFSVRTGSWAGEGMSVYWKDIRPREDYALETPFAALLARDATILLTEQIVVAYWNQIILLDPYTREFTLLAEGYSPVAAYEGPIEPIR